MMQKLMNKRNKKGFTLIELIVVIAIIAILAAIAIPRFGGFQGSANAKSVLATLVTIDTAAQAVASDNNILLSAVSPDQVVAALGWSAMPINSPKGIPYTVVSGVATATTTADIPWVGGTLASGTPRTATQIKAGHNPFSI